MRLLKFYYSIALLLLGLFTGGLGNLQAQTDCSSMVFLGSSPDIIGIEMPITAECKNPTYEVLMQKSGTSLSYNPAGNVTFHNSDGRIIALVRDLDPCTRYDFRVRVICNNVVKAQCDSDGIYQTIGCDMPTCDGVSATLVNDNNAILTIAGFENCRQGRSLFFETQWRPVGSSIWNSETGKTTAAYKHLANLQPCTEYEFRIRVECDGDYTAWCTGTFKTDGCPCDDCGLSVDQITQQSQIGCAQSLYVSTTMTGNCNIVSYDFDFGDGVSATSTQNPTTKTYTESGKYNVCVTVNAVTQTGDTCSVQYCDSIEVSSCVDCDGCNLQISDFEVFPSSISACTQIAFVQPTIQSPCSVQNIVYDWGDGSTTSSPFPIALHAYTSDGIFKICATVHGDNGFGEICKQTVCKWVFISGCNGNNNGKKAVRKTIQAFPNPVSPGAALTVDLPQGGAHLTLLDLNGRTVLDKHIPTGGNQRLQIPSDIPAGIYILRDEAGKFEPQSILIR